MKVTVLGASGGLGGAIARELVARGHDVTATSRAAVAVPGARAVALDLETPDTAARIADVATGSDVIVMAAQPPYGDWRGRWEPMLAAVLAGTATVGARLVFVDNLYAYGVVDAPITAATPERPPNAKCALRRDLGHELLAAHERGAVTVAIARLSDYHGPDGPNSSIFMLGIEPLLSGKPAQALLDADQPHTWHYLPDTARMIATLVEDDRGDGRVWILPAAEPMTQRQMFEIVAELVGRPAKVRTLTRRLLRLASPFYGPARDGLQVAQQFDRPWVVDSSEFERTFGPAQVTPHREALAATVAWAQRRRLTRAA
jgi:nucleoside-diphosphate-sugar epimerase